MGVAERKHTETHVVAHVIGTREDAMAELEKRARRHVPEHPRMPKRSRLFQDGDGFLLVQDGSWQSFSTRFTVARLLHDSAAPPPEEPQAGAEAPPAEPPAPGPPDDRYDDGVPMRPNWWGRRDLP
ncbi:hypothetical protein E4099_22675 [Streptomyces palmae]|uniref:Uncharacterized protein n=1 Tax=Streptomyces palmae TaxID=1701085 RepID=A0A4Z0GNS2_9ACTN|nr:hypothetical protein E4099_22675 [Streptomyces palmae]